MAHGAKIISYGLDIDHSIIERFASRQLNVEEAANMLAEKGFRLERFGKDTITLSTTFCQGKSKVTISFELDM
ncbi:hypothetical protein pA_gene0010 [Aeromonas phage phiA008]|nr:hypothetical protein pA_gene0010 [Aeromonas phage phiA008]